MTEPNLTGRCPGCWGVFKPGERVRVLQAMVVAHDRCMPLGVLIPKPVPPHAVVFVNDDGSEAGRIVDLAPEPGCACAKCEARP